MIKIISSLLLIGFCFISIPAQAKLNVFACEPEWAALAKHIGGAQLNIYAATTAKQDPHHIQARPSLIAKARRADILFCSGADLEIGWLPVLLQKSANKHIQVGSERHFLASEHVKLLGQLSHVDRSMGDVHGGGNPHVHLSPYNMIKIAEAFNQLLQKLDADNQTLYQQNTRHFQAGLKTMLKEEQQAISQLEHKRIIVHHDNWPYLRQWLHLNKVATLEPKPGVPPTSSHLSSLLNQLDQQAADMIVYASYQSKRPVSWLAKRSGIPVAALSFTPDDWQENDALIHWYRTLIKQLSSPEPVN